MKSTHISYLVILSMCLFANRSLLAQFSMSGQFIPRLEFRNGYRALVSDDADPATFISQRSRIILNYRKKRMVTKISFQDVRVWGDEPQLSNVSNVAVHEAWAQIHFDDHWGIRLGRQELVYDDHRIVGNVDWLQQARSHDALLLTLDHEGVGAQFALAYNNERESVFKTNYSLANYRALGLLRVQKKYDNGLNLSLMSVTEGLEDDQGGLHYRWTLGPHGQYASSKYALTSTFYYQLGKNTDGIDLSAFLFSISNTFKFNKSNFGFGLDYVSGTDGLDASNDKINSFHTLFATNHKFYGFMDYFLNIPADTKGGGLLDAYAKLGNTLGNKSSLSTHLHYFLLANQVQDPDNPTNALDQGLGVELDLVYTLTINPEVQLKIGWSAMLPTDAMRVIRGGDKGHFNNWAWTMIAFKPQFFQIKSKEND